MDVRASLTPQRPPRQPDVLLLTDNMAGKEEALLEMAGL
jgi:hypothetical protein